MYYLQFVLIFHMKKLILIGLLVFISVSGFVTYNIYKEKEHTRDLISFTENLQSQ